LAFDRLSNLYWGNNENNVVQYKYYISSRFKFYVILIVMGYNYQKENKVRRVHPISNRYPTKDFYQWYYTCDDTNEECNLTNPQQNVKSATAEWQE